MENLPKCIFCRARLSSKSPSGLHGENAQKRVCRIKTIVTCSRKITKKKLKNTIGEREKFERRNKIRKLAKIATVFVRVWYDESMMSFSRRWRRCRSNAITSNHDDDADDEWRLTTTAISGATGKHELVRSACRLVLARAAVSFRGAATRPHRFRGGGTGPAPRPRWEPRGACPKRTNAESAPPPGPSRETRPFLHRRRTSRNDTSARRFTPAAPRARHTDAAASAVDVRDFRFFFFL